ncbi:flagellar motor protein MotB [uncultured Jannaschia sp.]|uniref:OmpA/MotB family protein n=1 Tax=uncultured Jannaschia sp. TaxID=293347 RepID=UPI0026267206|nr:flagellar motor protein MotB [uncultured Jannaschia sp.]
MDNSKRPIIIKKKKVVGGGHHGGAWKVAYADFVTAMMAFFMLMWLLNATSEQQRKGLADYFSPTVALSTTSGGGDGAMGGRSAHADSTMVQIGRGGITSSEKHGTTEQEDAELEAIAASVMGKGGDSLLDEAILRHVAIRLTDEGLVLEFFDLPGSPLFEGTTPTPLLRALLAAVAGEIRQTPKAISIEAYTAAEPLVTRKPRAWEVSSERAHALRRALPAAGVSDARIVRVTGHADRRPAVAEPTAVRNNRVEIVVLRDRVAPRRYAGPDRE